jgi:hypothetical protein
MILGMEIALLCAGLYALVTGRFTVTRNRVVHGAPARLLGLLALLPFPLCFAYGVQRAADMAAHGQDPAQLSSDWNMIALEAGVVIVCAFVVFGLGALMAETPQSRSRPQYSDDEFFRRAYPERFGGDPASATAYQQGTTKLQTAALFAQRAAPAPDVARPPERKRSSLSPWMTFILIAFLLGIVVMVVEQQTGGILFPAPPERALGDHNETWKHFEVADPPAQVPGALEPKMQRPGATVFLNELQEFAYKPGAPGWTFGKYGSLGSATQPNQRVRFHDQPTTNSLCLHPPDHGYTRVCYYVGQRAQALRVEVGISDHDPKTRPSPVRFVVLGDGKVIWRSTSLRGSGRSEWIKLDVHHVDVLELRVYAEEGVSAGAHAIWLNPYVEVRR